MKKYLLTLLAIFVVLAPNVKADDDTKLGVQNDKYVISSINSTSGYDEFPDFKAKLDFFNLEHNRTIFLEIYNSIMNLYNTNYKSIYPYYQLDYGYSTSSYSLSLFLYSSQPSLVLRGSEIQIYPREDAAIFASYDLNEQTYINPEFKLKSSGSATTYAGQNKFYDLILTTNFDLKITTSLENINTVEFLNFRDKGTLTLKVGDSIPQFYAYDKVFDKLDTSTTTTVNLDNYEYVILNLKDYNQDKAFTTNLKVKGSVGITPVYNFGQTEKSDIIGTKIEDRCNVKYDEFTDYRLSILKQDLKNNAVYIVKSCEEGSSFKFDNTIFDVTYVTADNVDDPVVTIGGKDYHTIPFNKLTSSANQNEEENYVPGESKKLNLSDIVSNITNTVSSFWDSIVNFMSLVTKFFNTLPIEIKGVAITTFSMACMIALIKFLKS